MEIYCVSKRWGIGIPKYGPWQSREKIGKILHRHYCKSQLNLRPVCCRSMISTGYWVEFAREQNLNIPSIVSKADASCRKNCWKTRDTLLKAHTLLIFLYKTFSSICELLPSTFSLVLDLKLLRLWTFGSSYLYSVSTTQRSISDTGCYASVLYYVSPTAINAVLSVQVGSEHHDMSRIKEIIWKKKLNHRAEIIKQMLEKFQLKPGWILEEVFWKNSEAWGYA